MCIRDRNVNPKSTFIQLDLQDKQKTENYINEIKPEYVFHLAADATEGRSQFTPINSCLLYTSPSPRDRTRSRMPSSA